jgi:hypothetical protein
MSYIPIEADYLVIGAGAAAMAFVEGAKSAPVAAKLAAMLACRCETAC